MRFQGWGQGLFAAVVSGLVLAAPLQIARAGNSADGAVVEPAGPAVKPPGAMVSKASAPAKRLRIGIDVPDIRSNAALILDEVSHEVLYSKKADVASPIASITKLMTALVVLEAELPLDEKIELAKADRDDEKGSYSRLAIGAKLSRGDLLKLALMSSENRAAHALGRTYPGGMTAFVKAMNAKAKELGMAKSRFVEPTGLSSENVASPSDLTRLVIAASENPVIREYSTQENYDVAVGRQVLSFRNTNTLVSNPGWDVLVQKTGYISEAGQCLVMKAMIDGRAIVFVLLDSFGKYTRVADAKRVRTWMQARQLSASSTR
jgi:D-alanyl-D-alanine endopeptidase (penicillin-binding protein 7)